MARDKGTLRGKQPELSAEQQRKLVRVHGTSEHTLADLAEVFTISRTTVYRTLQRDPTPTLSVITQTFTLRLG